MPKTNSPITAAAYWMLITLISFSVLAVAVRELTKSLGTAEILFFRSLFGLIIIAFIVYKTGTKQLKTRQFKKHALRNVAHFLGQYGWVTGIAFIPLADVFALEFTTPIWAVIIAAVMLKEKISRARIAALVFGIIGVMVILQPSTHAIHPAALAVLAGAASYALSHTLTKSIAQFDSPVAIIFYMSLIQLPIAFILSITNWVMPSGIMWLWLVTVAACALLAHYCMAKALSLADAMLVIPLDFLRLPLIMLVGLLLYNEQPEWSLLAGASLMLLGNYLNLKYARTTRNT